MLSAAWYRSTAPGSTSARCSAALLAALLALALSTSCAVFTSAGMRANERAKAATMAAWSGAVIDGRPALRYLAERVVILLGGADSFEPLDQNISPPTGRPMLAGQPAPNPEGGAAFAVDARGYFLTAAHCIEHRPQILVTSRGSELFWWPARVVWSGAEQDPPVDLALVHAPCTPDGVIPWPRQVPDSGPVLCAGSGISSDRFCAGKLTGVHGSTTDDTFTELTHDAPLSVGDSGGPAIAADGTLVGVNVMTRPMDFIHSEAESTAILPQEAFIRGLIERDVREGGR